MGGDGQALTNKRALFNAYHQQDAASAAAGINADVTQRAAAALEVRRRWRICYLTGAVLCPPLMLDRLGNMLNKEAVIAHLVDLRGGGAGAIPPAGRSTSHIRKLAHVKDLIFAPNRQLERFAAVSHDDAGPGFNANKSDAFVDDLIRCPVTGDVAGPEGKPFVCCWDCGHVTSADAVRLVREAAVATAATHGSTAAAAPPCFEASGCAWPGCRSAADESAADPARRRSLRLVPLLPRDEHTRCLLEERIAADDARKCSRAGKRKRESPPTQP